MTNQEIICAAFRALESGDPKSAAGYFTEDFVWLGTFPRSLDKPRFMQLVMALKIGFPDYALNVKCCSQESDAVLRATMEPWGTHTATFALPGLAPIKATGTSVAPPRQVMEISLQGDKISQIKLEHASGGGLMGLLESLGVELDESELENIFK